MAGQPVTVWGEERSPRKEYVAYYTDVLNQIGFKATPKIIADASYFPTIGNAKTDAADRLRRLDPGLPEPERLLPADGRATRIQPTNNQNFSQVNDPHIQSELEKLNPVPADELDTRRRAQWQELDQYLAQKAYIAAYGTEQRAEVLLGPDRLRLRGLPSAVRQRLVVVCS